MSTLVIWICGIILTAAAGATVYRIWRGPTLLDRVLASDVLVAIIVAVLCVNMVAKDSYELITLVLVVSVVGFIGSVTVARYANNAPSREKRLRPSRIQEINKNDPEAAERLKQAKEQGPKIPLPLGRKKSSSKKVGG